MIVTPGANLGTGDFTWESWVYLNSTGSNSISAGSRMCWVDTRNGSNSSNKYSLYFATGGKLGFYAGGGTSFLYTSNEAVPTGSWQHIAFVRSAGTFRFYINGNPVSNSYTAAWTLSDTTNVSLGTTFFSSETGLSLDGYLDNVRLSNVARYTSNYTVPTASFEVDANTILLLNDNYVKSGINNSYTPSLSYDSSAGWTTDYAPFAGGTSLHPWKYSVNNLLNTGSATVTPGVNLGLSDFTWESWVYLNSTGSNLGTDGNAMFLLDTRNGASSSNKYSISVVNGKLAFFVGTGASYLLTSSLSVPLGSWQHIAFVRSVNSFRFYINGTQDTNSYTAAWSLSDTTNIRLGNSTMPNNQIYSVDGYMSNIRLSNVARYTSNYTVPTASFVKDDKTILLINGPEYDNAITNLPVGLIKNSVWSSTYFSGRILRITLSIDCLT